MKIAIIYPPFQKDRGEYPLLTQNRQFRYSKSMEVRIFPLIPASAATLLKNNGHDVLFLDGINKRMPFSEFENKIGKFNPALIVMETKAPIIKEHWKFIEEHKKKFATKFALVGDHVSFFPKESLKNSKADFILVGGDFDVGLLELVERLSSNKKPQKGVWYKERRNIVNNGRLKEVKNLDSIPFIDRDLTDWQIYGEAYLYHPCAYILTGRGCGGNSNSAGRCTFCVWQHGLWNKKARLRSPANVAKEIEVLVKKYKVKEIFDDNEAGSIWNYNWLKEFYKELERINLIGKFFISTNARADSLNKDTCRLIKNIGFRLLKVGLESGCNSTLKKICKLETIEQIKGGIKTAKDYGFRVLITTMVGYPWESEADVKKTYEATKELMLYKTRLGDSLQSSVIIPYPGTPLFDYALKKGYFKENPHNYELADQSIPILKTNIDTNYWCKKIWAIHYHPLFILKSMISVRSLDDIRLIYRGVKSLFWHIQDYKRGISNK